MPESTIAIVGALNWVAFDIQSTGAPTVHAHFCGFERYELICTVSFGTMAATIGIRARNRIW